MRTARPDWAQAGLAGGDAAAGYWERREGEAAEAAEAGEAGEGRAAGGAEAARLLELAVRLNTASASE